MRAVNTLQYFTTRLSGPSNAPLKDARVKGGTLVSKHRMRHTREEVCASVLENDKSVEPARASVHTGISEIADGLVWYEFIDTMQVFWATLDERGGLWISEDEL